MRGRARLQVHACLAQGWRKDLAFPRRPDWALVAHLRI